MTFYLIIVTISHNYDFISHSGTFYLLIVTISLECDIISQSYPITVTLFLTTIIYHNVLLKISLLPFTLTQEQASKKFCSFLQELPDDVIKEVNFWGQALASMDPTFHLSKITELWRITAEVRSPTALSASLHQSRVTARSPLARLAEETTHN